jgi:hypothetical protein
MGSDAEHKNEIDSAIIPRVRYVADRLSQTRLLGELRAALSPRRRRRAGPLPRARRRARRMNAGRSAPGEITLADLTGTGVQDTAIATLAVARARASGRGPDLHLLNPGSAMPDVALNFERTEYADRLARVRAAMAEADLDLLWITDPRTCTG